MAGRQGKERKGRRRQQRGEELRNSKQEEEEAEMAAGDAATPLLETAYQYHEGCPACAVERSKALNPGIPYMRFFHIWIIILVSCLPISSLFPFLYFMICIQYSLWTKYTLLDGDNYTISYRFIEWLTWTNKSTVSTSWAIGLIVGPAIGGYLAQPSEKYPILFPANSLFGRFPYFLPCLCISIFCFVILISCIWLPETLHKHATERNGDCKIGSLSTHLVDSEEFVKQHTSPAKDKSLFKNWPLMSSIVLFCIVSFDDMAYTEIFSLWSESDKQFGGLNFSSEDVGQVLAITGASILIYQTFIYPHIVKVLGIINTSRVAVILSMSLLCSYPPMTYLSRPWLSIVVNIASMLKNNFVVTINTCSFILQNNSVPQHQRATANGLATTLMSFFKAFAPAGAGILFSWAQKRQHEFFFPDTMLAMFFLSRTFFPAVLPFRNSVCLRTCTGRQAIKFLGSVSAQLLLFCFDFFLYIAMASTGNGAPGAGGNGGTPGGGGKGGAPGDNTNGGNTNASTSSAPFSGGEEADHGRRRQAEAPLLEKKGSTGAVGDGYCIERCGIDRRKAASSGIPYRSFLFVWIITLCTDRAKVYRVREIDTASEIGELMGDHGRRRQAEAAAPLLEKKGSTGTGVGDGSCIEGCPGCVVDRRKAASSGIPYGSFLFVWIVTLCTVILNFAY
uniref:Major facilitator superfamily (MFS) profile domain-containing protein n=1 Tax=Oryza glumipatula TaxID=40148 RepID=A0A0E0BF00_9ORYZ